MDVETQYLNLLVDILNNGETRKDRTGTGTIAVFGRTMDIDLTKGFPLLTTKRVPFNSVASELLWFLEGSGDERRLAEILHGTRDPEKKTIWSPNAEGTSGSKFEPEFVGDLGRIYGVQWRSWQNIELVSDYDSITHDDGSFTYFNAKVKVKTLDQVQRVIDQLKNNPTDRRMIISAWNPGELDQMALPPCHMFAQFYLHNDGRLDCQMYQRSVDTFLGLPFNIASYALLTHLIANEVGCTVGKLKMVLGDTHIYSDHIEQVKEQLSRTPHKLPELKIARLARLSDIKLSDISVIDYQSHPAIKAKMSA